MMPRCIHRWMARDERIGVANGGGIVVTHLKCTRCGFRRRMTFVNCQPTGGSDAARTVAYNATHAT